LTAGLPKILSFAEKAGKLPGGRKVMEVK